MFPKLILTSLAIGALSVNALAIPIAPRSPLGFGPFGRELPRSFSALRYRDLTFLSAVMDAMMIVPQVAGLVVPKIQSEFQHNPKSDSSTSTSVAGRELAPRDIAVRSLIDHHRRASSDGLFQPHQENPNMILLVHKE